MTNEQLDALFRKVFDDVEAGDNQLLATANGDSLTREETILTNMKAEVSALGDVPECQLSTERLRDAILSRGAMPERSSPFKNWWKFAVPVAASVAFGAFLISNPAATEAVKEESAPVIATRQEVPTRQTLEPTEAQVVEDVAVQPLATDTSSEPEAEASAPSVPVVSKPVVKRSKKPQQLASRSEGLQQPGLGGAASSAALSAEITPRSSAVSGLAAGAIEGFKSRESAPQPAYDSMAKEGDSTVVIVGAGADPNTRANPATEVDKKNVVFGG